MGSYWESIWRRLAVETGRVNWKTFRANPEVMRHIENPTTGSVLAVAQRCRDEFRVPVDLMRDSLVGGPRGALKFAGVPVTRASVEHARMAWAVRERIDDRSLSPIVVEIGGGFGGLAWSICRVASVAHYTFIDHPAVLRVQRKFVEGISEELEATGSMPRLGFTFVRSDEYEKQDLQVDVVVNTRSMMEMDHDEINRYFHWIAGVVHPDGFFYCVNRLEKVTRLEDWPWGLFEILDRRRWPEYLDRGPMDEIVARRKTE